MMHDNNPGRPLHLMIKESLARRISEGEWPPGGRLPGELPLCKEYSVSRITVRQALKGLEDAGAIERRRGSGTTVKPKQYEQQLGSMYSFGRELLAQGAEPSSMVLGFQIIPAEAELAARLSIAPGSSVYEIRRLRLAGGEPYALECSCLPVSLAGLLTRESVEQHGLYDALMKSCGISPRQAEETFRAAALPGEYAALLGVKKNAPVMHVERVALWNDMPVEYCVSWVRTDRMRFRVALR